LIRQTLGGWELSGIITLQSGFPFGIAGGYADNSGSLQGGDRADVVAGQSFNLRKGSHQAWTDANCYKTNTCYFNRLAFVENAPGTFGNTGRNMFQGPPVKTMDLAFAKNWTIVEGYRLQFRWEMFNALNHPSFNNPDNNLGDGNSFGRVSSVAIFPRVMQAALKFTF